MITCANCGARNEATARFCIKCGKSLVAIPPPKGARRRSGIFLVGGLLVGLIVIALTAGLVYYLLSPSPGPVAAVETTRLAPTATPTPTATLEPLATITITPEPSPVSEPPRIIELTVVYPDGESVTVAIHCPVPAEFCLTGVHINDFDGIYRGLGFNLPEGTPIFAVMDGQLDNIGMTGNDWGNGRWTFDFAYRLHVILPTTFFEYDHSGFTTAFPNPEVINGEFVAPAVGSTRVSGGQEIGRVIAENVDVGWDANGKMLPFNLIFAVKQFNYSDGTSTPCHIYLGSQPTIESPTSTSEPNPTMTVVLSDGSEASIACPVPSEHCRTATEIFRDDGSFYGLGFTLPEGTPILAVVDGETSGRNSGTWWSPASEPQSRYYPIEYTLTKGDLSFHYSYVDNFPTTLSLAEVETGQEFGRVAGYRFDKCVWKCWNKLDPFNFIFQAKAGSETLRMRVK